MAAWKKELRGFLSGAAAPAVLGVGSTLRQDDGAGIIACRAIERALSGSAGPVKLAVFLGESAPENLTGVILRYNPDRLLIIDAVDLQDSGEDVVFIPRTGVSRDFSASTHKMPIDVFCSYIANSIPCEVAVLGIIPQSCELGFEVTKRVRASALMCAREILECVKIRHRDTGAQP